MKSNFFEQFCRRTSLHGWKYIYHETGLVQKVIWMTVLFVVCCLSAFFLNMNINQYTRSKTRTSIYSTTSPLSQIIFPSVYICNINQVTKSFLLKLNLENATENTDLLFKEFIDGVSPNMTHDKVMLEKVLPKLRQAYNWNENIPFLQISSQSCSEMVIMTSYNFYKNFETKFYNAFKAMTDYGACCVMVPYLDFVNEETINVDPTNYTGKDFHSIPYGAKFSVKRGVKLMLDVESFNYAYFPRGSKGFKVALTDARDKAVINQEGYYVSPGAETLVALIPSVINTTNNALSRFEPKRRNCYQDSEFDFKNLRYKDGYRYSNKNCLYEAVIENIIQNCSCLPNFAQGRQATNVKGCQGRELQCALDWIKQMGNDKDPDLTMTHNVDGNLLKCFQRCEYQYEVAMPSSSTWPSNMFYYRTDICYALYKILRVCNDPLKRQVFNEAYGSTIKCSEVISIGESFDLCNKTSDYPNYNLFMSQPVKKLTDFLFDYAKNNFAVLKIFINYPFYTSVTRDEDMTTLSFIANAGGLLGLCMGLSFVSIFEILFFCFHGILVKMKKSVC